MAVFQINDASVLMNTIARQATGQADISVVDHTSFIDAGSKTLAAGTENVLNAIAKTIAYIVVASREYKGKFSLINQSESEWNNRIGKISFYSEDNSASGAFNTNKYTNIANGNNDSSGTGSQWEMKLPKVVENFFTSEYAWDKFYTTPLVQLQNAFNDEGTFIRFMSGVVTEVENDIETTLESNARMLVADRIAGTYLTGNEYNKINLTTLTNDRLGSTYTTKQLLTTNRKELFETLVAWVKILSDRMTERSTLYHDPMTIAATDETPSYNVLRHTPKDKQKLMLFGDLFTEASAMIMPAIFNTEYLKLENFEKVNYWQSDKDRMSIQCKPSLYNGATSSNVQLDNVVGILFDTDALATHNFFTGAFNTPVNARKLYYNTFYHYKYGAINDYSENAIIFYLEDVKPATT